MLLSPGYLNTFNYFENNKKYIINFKPGVTLFDTPTSQFLAY